MASRKDNKGRVLKAGESQRKDGFYQYRYTDPMGKRCYEYAPTLSQLREKEETIQIMLSNGLCYASQKMSVNELFERFLTMKKGQIRESSLLTYQTIRNLVQNYPFGRLAISQIRQTDVKTWLFDLVKEGYTQGYVSTVKQILHGVFELAVAECILGSNPCHFKLTFGVKEESNKFALSHKQQQQFLFQVSCMPKVFHLLPFFRVLLGTGMRISELVGLTKDCIDFKKNVIHVTHQLSYKRSVGGPAISPPKTQKGDRYIPMSTEVASSIREALEMRSFISANPDIDGHHDFIFMHYRTGMPYGRGYIRQKIEQVIEAYNKDNPDEPMPHITPHIFRHTFTSNLLEAGVPPKTVQYILGHADVTTTMNIYAHVSQEHLQNVIKIAEKQLRDAN